MTTALVSLFKSVKAVSNVPVEINTLREDIRKGRWKEPVEEVQAVLASQGKDAADERKVALLPAVTPSGTFNRTHQAKDLAQHSGLLCLDFDDLNGRLPEVRSKLASDPHCFTLFISPSGAGLKFWMRIKPNAAEHGRAFDAAVAYFKKTYDLEADTQCRDVSRLCFVSYDPSLVHNPDAAVFEIPVDQLAENATSPRTGKDTKSAPRTTTTLTNYVAAAVQAEVQAVSTTPNGKRNAALNKAAFALGQFVGAGVLPEADAEQELLAAARRCNLPDAEAVETIQSGLRAGAKQPRQLPDPRTSPKKIKKQAGLGLDDIIVLPGASTSITKSAENIFQRIAPSQELFIRGGAVMELREDDNGELRLDILRAQTFRSRIEKLGNLFAWRVGKKNQAVLKPTTCPADTAEALLSSQAAADILPRVRGLAACPVLVEVNGHPQVLAKGYHAVNGGLLVTAGQNPPELTIDEAVEALQLLVADFDFATPSDRSRAMASIITVALRIGGWLRGHIPIDMAEANLSQAGKGYRQNLIFAVYGEEPYRIALRDGGVGGLDESIQQALITARPFIQIDNVRGHLESQFIEMMTTAGGTVGARVPHKGEVLIDSRHFILMMTSNGVETTRDLANRASIIRIRKRPGYVFRKFPEGDLLDHVKANQPHFLGAVFAVIRAWHGTGKLRTTDTGHDFREWAQTLGWIVENILREAPLMAGHEQAQERVSNPALTWLRRVALAVETDQRLDEEIMAGSIGELCEAHAIEIPGLRDGSDEIKRNQRIGILMKKSFGDADRVKIDRCTIRRLEEEKYDQAEQRFRTLKSYVFALQATEAEAELPLYRRTAEAI